MHLMTDRGVIRHGTRDSKSIFDLKLAHSAETGNVQPGIHAFNVDNFAGCKITESAKFSTLSISLQNNYESTTQPNA